VYLGLLELTRTQNLTKYWNIMNEDACRSRGILIKVENILQQRLEVVRLIVIRQPFVRYSVREDRSEALDVLVESLEFR